ncbi:MAG: DUF452 family protein [Flavobacteriales bacterium]|nr:DUF452 family protein [Flavobacteriales bacterium]
MNYRWLYKFIECDTLIVFFNGWGMTEKVISGLKNEGCDVLVLGGYDTQNIDTDVFSTYKNVYLVAWSMGVWFASLVGFSKISNIRKKIAFCGTVKAMDDVFGIPKSVFEATVNGLSERSREKFAMRIFGGKKAYDAVGQDILTPFDESEKELHFWAENASECVDENQWDVAVVGCNDMIYSAENQMNYWKNNAARIVELQSEHYPFGAYESWKEIIEL